MRKIGVIAGTSWASTAHYLELINKGIAGRLGGLHSAQLLLESLDLAQLAELRLAGEWAKVAEIAGDCAKRLQAAAADSLLFTSCSMHKVHDEVAASVSIPLLNVADAVGEQLQADGRRRVGLLGTRLTMTDTYFRERIEARAIQIVLPDEAWLPEIDRIIHEELIAGRVVRDSQRKLKTLITELSRQKVDAIVLGATDLAQAVDTRANILPVYDSGAIHARAAVSWMLDETSPGVRAAA